MTATILFVGFGRMGQAIAAGLRKQPEKHSLICVSPAEDSTEQACKKLEVIHYTKPEEVTETPDLVLFAVKPQVAGEVVSKYKWLVGQDALFLTIMAGVSIGSVQEWLGGKNEAGEEQSPRIVRAMPNTPAAIGEGITALVAAENVKEDDKRIAEAAMAAVGEVVWLPQEDLMHAVTALSGSGPAWFFALMEAMESAALAHGLSPELARKLTVKTAQGSGKLALNTNLTPAELRENVTSPGGTTEAGLQVFAEEDALQSLVQKAINAAAQRSRELAKQKK